MLATSSKKLFFAYHSITKRCYMATTNMNGKILAIRREDQSVWERRAPLAPSHVKKLVKKGVKVIVQPSNRRAYPMQMYQNAGAKIQEDISEADVVIGVKQVPIDQLIPHKTYAFFSHTIKAQEANMPLLDAILEKNIRLIDYERMVDERGNRLVAFGKYAGAAGMINILHGLGLRLLALGHHTPLMHIGPAHNYRNIEMARQALRDAGYEISLGMMPKSIGPLTFVFTGTGNVSQGAADLFQNLPYEYVPVSALKKISEHGATNKVYGCEISRQDHLVKKDGGKYNAEEYEEHPERYISLFPLKIAPYASVIVNGIYYAVNSPKLITIPDAKALLQPLYTPWLPVSIGSPALPHKLLAICDISADPGGSIEFVTECTTIDTPFCLYDADQNKDTVSFKGPGVLVCSIDNMPTQLPRESTDYFGDLLMPYIKDIICSDAKKEFEEKNFCPEVASAVLASNGKLTPNFEYIAELRRRNRAKNMSALHGQTKTPKVLILGAGHVSEPMVEYLSRDSTIGVTVECEPLLLDVKERPDLLDEAIQQADLVISLLPSNLHAYVLQHCISNQTNMLTASYCTPDMKELHDASVEAGITVLNEVVEIPAGGTLLEKAVDFDFLPGLALEGFPNRDSTLYQDLYGIHNAVHIERGTLRYKGFSNIVIGLQKLGLLDHEPHTSLHPKGPELTWRQLICSLLNQMDATLFYDNLKALVAERVGSEERMEGIETLGLLKDDPVAKMGTPLDTLSYYLSKKLKFEKGEKDLIVMRHSIRVLWPDGSRELRGISLVCYGDPEGYTAMAKTVSYPAAIAAKMILDGEIQTKGMSLIIN
ncbi:Alpha-aminoadipic semialdehyde synthase, mitochondrial [Armadillidium nasatum]|uniref:Alpha-aminoadipic semialdehyde synthase, mitochondrial n=1 Tax=Armadillidium nasatum TaxID=96803 RepID=A0A5N5SMF2_9CRUS|nr:Alpha-aminoadipic semialdehyde synthase, mitochondrial [Armadillidium nasatum]